MKCSVCFEEIQGHTEGVATQVFRRSGVVVTVTGIPTVAICPNCGNAILEWDIAQQVEELVAPLFQWAETHTLPKPVVSITFPEPQAVAATVS